jgi:hypothetical protein
MSAEVDRPACLLVLQAYGSARIVQEARFAVLTFLHHAAKREDSWRVVIYTDQPGAFADLGAGVFTEPMDAARVRAWRGRIDFVHRVKLEVLLDCLQRHPGTLLYVDSDTWFDGDPWLLYERIGATDAVMHECEGRLHEEPNGVLRKMHRFVRGTSFQLPDGERVQMSGATEMWNAGVIGLDANVAVPLLQRALALTDTMHAQYQKHVTEQLAVSWVLQTDMRLRAASDVVHHYWRTCAEVEKILEVFFQEHAGLPLPRLAEAASKLKPRVTPAPKRRWWRKLAFHFRNDR